MQLRSLIHSGASIVEIASFLDGLPGDARLAEAMSLRPRDQRALWDRCVGGQPITLQHFVPAGTPANTEVIHHGRNTLPIFRFFQKRFALPAAGANTAGGYNEGFTRRFIGPGYFVLRDTAAEAAWAERGAWVVDYHQVPQAPVVEGWPTIVPNSVGLQMFVYKGTRDFMRRVSSHVSIGRAWKGETALPAWFVLCREP